MMNAITTDYLVEAFEFMIWGDRRILAAARALPEEAYYREHGFSMGSVHKLLVHAMAAQDVWLRRWRREDRPRILTVAEVPTRGALEERWPGVHEAVMGFVRGQSRASIDEVLHYHNNAGQALAAPLKVLMAHVADHGTYHRGQANSMIKLSGGTPVPIMVVTQYYEEQGVG